MAKNANTKNKEFPITVSGGDNIIYDLSAEDLNEIANTEKTNELFDELQTFKDFVNNAQTRTKEQLMHFVKNFMDGMDVTSPNFDSVMVGFKSECKKLKEDLISTVKSEDSKIKLTPGGKINSQQELNKVINQCNDKLLEKALSDLEKNSNALEKLCNDIGNKVNRLTLDDKEIVRILNNTFTITNISINLFLDMANVLKNVAKKNIETFNSLLKQLQ